MYRYYPSCVFRTIDIHTDDLLRQYAASHDMEIAGCCRVDKKKTAPEDKSLYLCQACRTNISFIGNTPESLWQYFDQDASFSFPDYHGMAMTLQDCWRDREHPEIHQAVRSLLKKMKIEVIELPANRKQADFCGRFHCETKEYAQQRSQFDPQIHLDHLPDNLYEKIMTEHVKQYPTECVICYCNTCYKGIAAGGGHPVHLAQLLFRTASVEKH